MEQTATPWAASASPLSIAELRTELGLSLAEMGARVGLSKSQMHDIERRNAATLRVAIALENLAPGRIDAAAICEEVKLARHGAGDSAKMEEVSQGKAGENSPDGLPGARSCFARPDEAEPGGGHGAAGGSLPDAGVAA